MGGVGVGAQTEGLVGVYSQAQQLIHSLGLGNRKTQRQVPRAGHWAGWFVYTPSYQQPP